MTDVDLLLTICRRTVDPGAQPLGVHAGHDHTRALRAATRSGDVIIKIHRSPERHRQEVHAYHHWVPALGERAPRLLAVHDDPPAIVISAVDGRPLAELTLAPEAERAAYRQAGELLRHLHHAGNPRTEPDMTTWLAGRGECWLYLAEPILPAQQRATIRAHLHALTALGHIPAVPCHLDYMPRNLLRAADGTIAVIDFEHSRYDLAARDLVRVACRVWPHRPDLKAAFLHGYGQLSTLDRRVIEHCSYLDVLTSAVCAQRQSREREGD